MRNALRSNHVRTTKKHVARDLWRALERQAQSLVVAGEIEAMTDAERVHAMRRSLRQLRVLAGFARASEDERSFRAFRDRMRGHSDALDDARDADALLVTFDRVVAKWARDEAKEDAKDLARVRRHAVRAAREAHARSAPALRAIIDDAHAVALATADIVPPSTSRRDLEREVRRAGRRARAQLVRLEGELPKPVRQTELHILRRRVKVVRAHVALLRPRRGSGQKEWKRSLAALESLCDRLGDAHDLDALVGLLERMRAARGLRRWACKKRDALQERALKEARRVFAAKPRAYAARLVG